MNTSSDWELEQQLRESLGSPPKADFDRWRARHGDAVAYLNPIVTTNYRKRRRMIVRIASGSRRRRGSLVARSHVCSPAGVFR